MQAETTGRMTVAQQSFSWTGAIIVSALALVALYIGTAVVVSVVQWTAKAELPIRVLGVRRGQALRWRARAGIRR